MHGAKGELGEFRNLSACLSRETQNSMDFEIGKNEREEIGD